MQVARWGSSLAVQLPAAMAEALSLAEGDDIRNRILGTRDMAVERGPDRGRLLDRVDPFEGRLPEGFVFNRDDARRG